MASHPRSDEAFSVEFTVEASRQLTRLGLENERDLEDALDRLANAASLLPLPSAAVLRRAGIDGAGVHLLVGDVLAVYEVSEVRRAVIVTELLPRSGASRGQRSSDAA